MARMTKMEHFQRFARRKPAEKKITRLEAQAMLNTLVKRQAVAAGVIDPTKARFRWQWHCDGESGYVEANTRSEARGLVKKALGVPRKERLPVGVAVFKVGVVEGREIPHLTLSGREVAA